MAISLFEPINAQITVILTNYITVTATHVMQGIAPVLKVLIMLSFSWFAWGVMTGLIRMPVMETFKKMLRASVILSLATSIGLYNEYVSNWLWQSPDALANLVSQTSGNGVGSSGVSFGALDQLLFDYYQRGKKFWDMATINTIPNVGFWIIACGVWFAGLVMSGYIAYLLILSKIGLAVLLGVGPIFIMLTIFDTTRKFFDAWMGQVVNFLFINMFTFAISGVMLAITNRYVGK